MMFYSNVRTIKRVEYHDSGYVTFYFKHGTAFAGAKRKDFFYTLPWDELLVPDARLRLWEANNSLVVGIQLGLGAHSWESMWVRGNNFKKDDSVPSCSKTSKDSNYPEFPNSCDEPKEFVPPVGWPELLSEKVAPSDWFTMGAQMTVAINKIIKMASGGIGDLQDMDLTIAEAIAEKYQAACEEINSLRARISELEEAKEGLEQDIHNLNIELTGIGGTAKHQLRDLQARVFKLEGGPIDE